VANADQAACVARFVSIFAACVPDERTTKDELWLQSRDRRTSRKRKRPRVQAAARASAAHRVRNRAARTWIGAVEARRKSTSRVAPLPAAKVHAAPSSRLRLTIEISTVADHRLQRSGSDATFSLKATGTFRNLCLSFSSIGTRSLEDSGKN